MMYHPVKDIPVGYLRGYINDTALVTRFPGEAGADQGDPVHQEWMDRNQELRDELRRLKTREF